jgi:hypothetical protein
MLCRLREHTGHGINRLCLFLENGLLIIV